MSAQHVPDFLRERGPATSDLLIVDERLPLMPLIRALAEAGYTVINDRTGRLVITQRPADFRSSHNQTEK